jgi:hypothetical protein
MKLKSMKIIKRSSDIWRKRNAQRNAHQQRKARQRRNISGHGGENGVSMSKKE